MSKTTVDQAALRHQIERMVASRLAMNVHRDELVELRRHARSEGLNIQGLNALVDLLAENTPDRGARVVGDLLTYAEAAGTALETRMAAVGDGSNRTPTTAPSSDVPNGKAPSVLYQTYGAPRIASPVSSAGRRVPAMPDIGQRA